LSFVVLGPNILTPNVSGMATIQPPPLAPISFSIEVLIFLFLPQKTNFTLMLADNQYRLIALDDCEC
jgi:hypothetical protein